MREMDLDALPRSDMAFVEPMRPRSVNQLPEGPNWQYEIKWDGYRALAIRDGGKSALVSRRNNSFVNRFPSIAASVRTIDAGSIVDGEIVALDVHGRPSFNLLQHRVESARTLVYFAFDLLAFQGRDVRQLALAERRGLLEKILKNVRDPVRGAPILDAAPKDLIPAVKAEGLEGIVAKRVDSRYESRGRSTAWVKLRVNRRQELVIGGYHIGNDGFENLAVGYYNEAGRLIFAARIKNGFTPGVKKHVLEYLLRLEIETCPFANLPEPSSGAWGEGLVTEAMTHYRWVRPELVSEVEFTEWTPDGHLRHSRFVALRDDKDAREVRKER